MIRILVPLLFVFSSISGQDIKVYDTYAEFKELLQKEDGKIHVVNFWATWCAPCIKELPYLEELRERLGDKGDVTLVSLDFGSQLDSKVKPFVNKKELKSKVVLLDDPKSNVWIDLIDKSWSGAIPATVFYKGQHKQFYEKEFHSTDELLNIISSFK